MSKMLLCWNLKNTWIYSIFYTFIMKSYHSIICIYRIAAAPLSESLFSRGDRPVSRSVCERKQFPKTQLISCKVFVFVFAKCLWAKTISKDAIDLVQSVWWKPFARSSMYLMVAGQGRWQEPINGRKSQWGGKKIQEIVVVTRHRYCQNRD